VQQHGTLSGQSQLTSVNGALTALSIRPTINLNIVDAVLADLAAFTWHGIAFG